VTKLQTNILMSIFYLIN